MDAKLKKELSAYILKELLRSRDRSEIITEVCHRANIFWVDAEYLVERTERENKQLLRQEKNPVRLGISVLGAAIGLIWILVSFIRLFLPLVRYRLENGSAVGYVSPVGVWELILQLLVAITMVVIGMILTLQQLKSIHR